MKDKTKTIQTILLLGALWGVCEAGIGYALHFLPPGFSGMLMVPIGFYFMFNAYRQSGERTAVLWVGLIAASVKLIDLLLPMRSPMGVINPVAAIMLESLLVFAFAKLYDRKQVFPPALLLGLSWMTLFTLAQALVLKPASGLYLQPPYQIVSIVILNTLVGALLITLYLKTEALQLRQAPVRKDSFALPVFSLVLAFVLELVNSLIV
ncbi:MAG: hypothetical protein JXR21_02570 [Candidatus Marinimicrobia bacterium]|nr:hypothetical protein [Candidatus Neomarinimicrobiota bacterium]